MQVMGDVPGVPGLFVAGVFSGALSTVSSGLNSLSAVFLKDFVISGCGKELDEAKSTKLAKMLTLVFGIVSYGVVFLVKYLPGVLEAALGIFGIVGGPVLGAFVLGMFFPFANTMGAFIGALSSVIFTMWMGFGSTAAKQAGRYDGASWSPKMPTSIEHCPQSWLNYTQPDPKPVDEDFAFFEIYAVSYMWYSAVACIWALVVGILISLIKPQDLRSLDPRLITPALKPMVAWWPGRAGTWVVSKIEEIGADLNFDQNENVEKREEKENTEMKTKGISNEGFEKSSEMM